MRTFWPTLACAASLTVCAAHADAAGYRAPRLADGRPDLQGTWDHVDATPLERPPGFTTLAITPEQRPTSERCLGNPAAQPPNLYNPGTNLRQIVQTPDTVLIVSEVIHFVRDVRMNARHAPAAVTSWAGDSIGWWEGDTLVVETSHFTPSDRGRVAAGIAFLTSPDATVTERITRVSDDEINYVFTVDDPGNYTRPWTGETHLMRTNDPMLEYACHEGNYSLRFILQGGRARD